VAASCQSFEGRVRVFIARERQRDLLKEIQDAAVAAAQVSHDKRSEAMQWLGPSQGWSEPFSVLRPARL
jgi:hypothetical protein